MPSSSSSSWLEQKPEEKLFTVWRHYIQSLERVAKPEVLQHLKKTVTQRAREIASATGGFLGIHKISEAEEAMIDEIERAFAETKDSGS